MAARRSVASCETCPLGRASRPHPCPFVPRSYEPDELIYLEGAPAERVRFVKRGVTSTFRTTRTGHEVVRAVRRPGSLLGAEALVRDHHTHASRAVTAATVCEVSVGSARAWIGGNSPARAVIELLVAAEADEAPRGARPDGSAVARTAAWILAQDEERITPDIPRRVLAGLLGMGPESLSRALAALHRKGAIETSRTTIVVRDVAALARIAA